MNPEQDTTTPSTQAQAPSGQDTQSAPPQATPSEGSGGNVADAGAGTQASQAQPPARPEDADPSLTPPKSVASTTQNQPETVDPDAFKRLRDEKSQWGRQMAEMKRNYESQRAQLAQLQQEREKAAQLAQQQKLPLYDYRHPEHATKFQPVLAKADIVRQQLAALGRAKAPEGLTPEQSEMWREQQRQNIVSALGEDEQAALEQFSQFHQSFQRDWALNPTKVLSEHVLPMIRQEMQRAQMEQQAQFAVQKDMEDPTLGPVLKEFREPMMEMIDKLGGTDEAYEMAKHHALVYAQNKSVHAENARLKQQLEALGVKANAAEAQQQLAKGRASITKDVNTRSARDPYEEAKKWAKSQGIDTMHPAFHRKHREIEAELQGRK
jgi:hypothetical protein